VADTRRSPPPEPAHQPGRGRERHWRVRALRGAHVGEPLVAVGRRGDVAATRGAPRLARRDDRRWCRGCRRGGVVAGTLERPVDAGTIAPAASVWGGSVTGQPVGMEAELQHRVRRRHGGVVGPARREMPFVVAPGRGRASPVIPRHPPDHAGAACAQWGGPGICGRRVRVDCRGSLVSGRLRTTSAARPRSPAVRARRCGRAAGAGAAIGPASLTRHMYLAPEERGRTSPARPRPEGAQIDSPDPVWAREAARTWRAAALNVLASPLLHALRQPIIDHAARNRLPAIYQWEEAATAGGLMSYGPSRRDVFRTIGVQLDRVLKGAKAADLPVEQPTKFELVINLKTPRALNLTIPPSLLARADQVIE